MVEIILLLPDIVASLFLVFFEFSTNHSPGTTIPPSVDTFECWEEGL